MTSSHSLHPTPYKDINALLLFMLTKIQAILGDQLAGFYLYGSLSSGDFDPTSSDVDFLVVTREDMSEEIFESLRDMHAIIATSNLPYANYIEGSYIPLKALQRYDPHDAHHPTIGIDWPFRVAFHGSNWILERYILREHGVIVYGPSPQTLIDPVTPEEMRIAVCEQLKNFWSAQLDKPEWLRTRDYQAFAVLTLCRALYTLHHGTVCSKPQAALWAQETYPQWKPIIERSLLWRTQHEEDDLTETMTFLHNALIVAQTMCLP
jgi:predicted nucleotidyltransferase